MLPPEIRVPESTEHRIEPPVRVRTDRGDGDILYLIASRIGSSFVVKLDLGGYYVCDPQKVTPLGRIGPQLIVDNS